MRELQKIIEQKLEGLIANRLENYRPYVSLVKALAPEQAEPDEDCVNLIAKKVSQVYSPNMQLERIVSFLELVGVPTKHASLLGPKESWEGTWKILFGDGVDYSDGLKHQESFEYVRKVHEAYQKRVGSTQNPREGSLRILQQRVMPVDEDLADVFYRGMLIENPEWHLRTFLEFVKSNRGLENRTRY
ncbi:MAG: hypothetical protein ABH840_02525 [Nanoarchaeota archaeon]